MTKQTKLLLGVGAIAVAYLIWKSFFKPNGVNAQTPVTPENRGDGHSISQGLVDEYNKMAEKQLFFGNINGCRRKSKLLKKYKC